MNPSTSDTDIQTPPSPDQLDDPIPQIVLDSQAAFRRDLDRLLSLHPQKWVAYSGNEQIGIGCSETELYKRCFQRGLEPGQFVVRSIEPQVADEDA
jgi:hypothetical protein